MKLKSKSFLKLIILFILTSFFFFFKVGLAQTPVLRKVQEKNIKGSRDLDGPFPKALSRRRRPLPEGLSSVKVSRDLDKNKIEDLLDELIDKAAEPDKEEKILVLLNVPFDESHLDEFRFLRGRVKHTYKHTAMGFSGTIPVGQLKTLADRLGPHLKIIKKAKPILMHLDKSMRIIRVRNAVWTYGYTGTSTNPVAVLDTGIDDSHADLSGKVAAWHDTTADASTSPEDYQSHGTHVASTVAGTGTSLGSGSISTLTLTFSGTYPTQLGYGYVDMFELPSTGAITLNMYHGQGAQSTWLSLRYPDISTVLGSLSGTDDPLTGSWSATGTGTHFAISGQDDNTLTGEPYSTLETFPYQDVGDGYNLFTGVAPDADLVGVKIFDNTGSGWDTNMYAAFDWIIANRETYNIKVASMSAGLSVVDTDLRAAANNVVENGIVFTISAGNDYPADTINDPALASKIICVGATNDNDQITDYSSNGPGGSSKPDVVAPGGSFQIGSKITAVDTNDNDGDTVGFADRQANDYTNMSGTSMSCPHVAGLAALIIQALEDNGYTWNYTEADALNVKMLILMTASETNQSGEDGNSPTLNRGGKDLIEGYGRINADAAIEAVTTEHTGSTENDTLGSSSLDKKVWASKVNMPGGEEITFSLDVPFGADYDLYLYRETPDSNGDPVILASSISSATGNTEIISYTASGSEADYIVVKRVSGSGQFSLSSNLVPTPMIDVDIYEDSSYTQEDNFFDNADTVYIRANVTLDGSPLTGATVTAALKVNDGTTIEDSLVLDNEVAPGVYQKSWDSTSHTDDVYLVEVTTDYSPPGSGQAYFHLYPGSGVSAYRLDYDEDGNDDYVLESKHLLAVYDGRVDTDKLLLCLRQKDTNIDYTFAEISDSNSKGTGEVTTTNMKGLRFYSFAFSQTGENKASVDLDMTAEVIDPTEELITYYDTSNGASEDGNYFVDNSQWIGERFDSSDLDMDYTLTKVSVYVDKGTRASNPLIVEIRNDSGGLPGSTVLASESIPASSVPSTSGWVEVTFSSQITLDENGLYWLVLRNIDNQAGPNYPYTWTGDDTTPAYPGSMAFSQNQGSSWNDASANYDMIFRAYGYPAAITTTFDLSIRMRTQEVDYLVYNLSNFDEFIDDINNIFSPISGSLGSSIDDDMYYVGSGTYDYLTNLSSGSWTDFSSLSDQEKYLAIYDNSTDDDPVDGNVISWIHSPVTDSVAFQNVGCWYETGKEALRISYDTTSATGVNQAEYILAFTQGDYSVIDQWMPTVAGGSYPGPNFMTPPFVLGVSVNPNTWPIGIITTNEITQSTEANDITVTNNGSINETFALNITLDGSSWLPGMSAGVDTYVIWGLFCGSADSPGTSLFQSEDSILLGSPTTATAYVFGDTSLSDNGVNLAPSGSVDLWFQFQAPTETVDTSQQNIIVTVGAEQTP